MATKGKSNINDSKDRFSSPIGIKNLVLPKKPKTGGRKSTSGKNKKEK